MVVREGRQDHIGHPKAGLFAKENIGVVGHGLVQRSAALFPIRNQLGQRLGVHDGARQDVRAWLRSFLEHHHRDLFARLGSELLDADGRGQAAGAAADDNDVVFHGFAGTELGQDFLVGHEALAR